MECFLLVRPAGPCAPDSLKMTRYLLSSGNCYGLWICTKGKEKPSLATSPQQQLSSSSPEPARINFNLWWHLEGDWPLICPRSRRTWEPPLPSPLHQRTTAGYWVMTATRAAMKPFNREPRGGGRRETPSSLRFEPHSRSDLDADKLWFKTQQRSSFYLCIQTAITKRGDVTFV